MNKGRCQLRACPPAPGAACAPLVPAWMKNSVQIQTSLHSPHPCKCCLSCPGDFAEVSVNGPEEGLYHSPLALHHRSLHHFLLLRRVSSCMLALWGFSYRPPTPKRLTLFSQIPARRFTARPFAGPPLRFAGSKCSSAVPVLVSSPAGNGSPRPRGVLLSRAAAGSAVRAASQLHPSEQP